MTNWVLVSVLMPSSHKTLNSALYLTPRFFQDKPVELLIGPGIQADDLNGTTLGRSMDSIYQYGATELYSFSLIAGG